MSYQLDLDEFTDESLENEIERRLSHYRKGECPYCKRLGNAEPSCKETDQHHKARRILQGMRPCP